MAKLFESVLYEGLANEWVALLDWLFDDDKFNQWSSSQTGRLTKKIKKLPGLGSDNYKYDVIKNLVFVQDYAEKHINVIVGKNNSESKDWVKHIRNGIAHGRTSVIKNSKNTWIEIKDFNTRGQQTAYFYMPIEYIGVIYKLFTEISSQQR